MMMMINPEHTSYQRSQHLGRADIRKAWAWLEDGVKELKHSILALYYAAHDPRTGWLPRLVAITALAYALSPLDLIPDFIPVLGFLDDLILLPGLIWLGIKLIPVEVWADAKERADVEPLRLNENWIAATMIFVLWDCIALYVTWAISRHFGNAYLLAHIWIPLLAVGNALVVSEVGWSIWILRRELGGATQADSESSTPDELGQEPLNASLIYECV